MVSYSSMVKNWKFHPTRIALFRVKIVDFGAKQGRTADLFLAKEALSQLSYDPTYNGSYIKEIIQPAQTAYVTLM